MSITTCYAQICNNCSDLYKSRELLQIGPQRNDTRTSEVYRTEIQLKKTEIKLSVKRIELSLGSAHHQVHVLEVYFYG